jgi:hypothetical protein
VKLALGKTYCTPGALGAFVGALDEVPSKYLTRHANGDGGELSESDRRANEYAFTHGLRVLSAYTLSSGEKIWVVTEADRSMTTILLPEEY